MKIKDIQPLSDGRFDCMMEHPSLGWIKFTADPNDSEYHGRAVAAAIAKAGADFDMDMRDLVPPEELKQRAMSELETRLSASHDLVMMDRWETYTEERKKEVTDFRQALRDAPNQEGFPRDIDWPVLKEE